jgi:putative oxidoreductase
MQIGVPLLSLGQALVIARIATAILFMAHAVARIWLDTIPQFGSFLEAQGLLFGVMLVWLITASELVSGILLIFNRHVRFAVIPLMAIAVGGIALIHSKFGWFVGEHGTGGSEYSVALIVLLIIIGAADAATTREAEAKACSGHDDCTTD